MVIIIQPQHLDRAKAIMKQYGSKLVYNSIWYNNREFIVISEGPIGALLLIRAELGNDALQKIFGQL